VAASTLKLLALCASLSIAATATPPAQAAIINLSGVNFDVQYDDTKLGLFGAPTLVGNNLIFTPGAFSAQSVNGAPAFVTTNSTINGIVLTAHQGFSFGGLSVTEIGNYLLTGVGSSVNVAGQLRAFDLANPVNSNTSANLSVSPSTPLSVGDGANHDWLAGATITPATASLLGLTGWLQQATQINLTIQNQLFAISSVPTNTPPSNSAFIQKSFAQGGVMLSVVPVPLPGSVLLMLSAILLGGFSMVRMGYLRNGGSQVQRRTKIAIVSINYAPELTGISVYSTGMAEHFARRGDDVTLYTAFTYYPAWKKSKSDEGRLYRAERKNGVAVRRSYLYVPRKPSASRRILHEFSFVVSTAVNYLFGPRADCTIIVSPPLFLGVPIAMLAWLKGSRSVFHVQDLQPDAAVDLGMIKPGALSGILFALERASYRVVDKVSTISEGMRNRIIAKGVAPSKIVLFRNWANDDCVERCANPGSLREAWGLKNKFVVLYSGNLGVKQGLGSALDAAAALQRHPDITFVIVGDGGEKANLVRHAETAGLTNVMFKPLQPSERLNELLASADVSIIPQKLGVKDIVLPSKLANIMASERSIVAAASPDSEMARILNGAECGIVVAPEDGAAMAAGILDLYHAPQRRAQMAANGRRYMNAHLREAPVIDAFRMELRAMLTSGRVATPQPELPADPKPVYSVASL
jgi:colanic acid biosynthesis glycosyl transferase WcaI